MNIRHLFRATCHGDCSRVVVALLVVALLLASGSGCGRGAGRESAGIVTSSAVPATRVSSATSLSPAAEAFRRAHLVTPSGMLRRRATTEAEVAATIVAGLDLGVPLLFSGFLPPEFVLSAPFRGTGSGAALPNPQIWGSGYAVTYTDGVARLTIVVGSDQDFGTAPWAPVSETRWTAIR